MTEGASTRYTYGAIILHWLIALVIIVQIALGFYMTREFVGLAQKFELYQLHKSVGVTVLFLSLARLAWRLTHKPPPLPVDMSGIERLLARVTHIGFYVLMIGLPATGWVIVSTSPTNLPTVLFDIIPWPHLPVLPNLEHKEEISEAFEGFHEFLAVSTLGLLALHIGAALKHHFMAKDDVLARMAPFIKQRTK